MVSCLFIPLCSMDDESERSRSGSSPLSFIRSIISSPRVHKSSLKNNANYSEIDSTQVAEQKYAGLLKHVYHINIHVKRGLITRDQADIMIKCYKVENGIVDK